MQKWPKTTSDSEWLKLLSVFIFVGIKQVLVMTRQVYDPSLSLVFTFFHPFEAGESALDQEGIVSDSRAGLSRAKQLKTLFPSSRLTLLWPSVKRKKKQ